MMASSSSHHSRSITSSLFHSSSSPSHVQAVLQVPPSTTATKLATTTTTTMKGRETAFFATRRSSRACIVPRPTRGVASPTGARVQNPSFTRRSLHSRRSQSSSRSSSSSSSLEQHQVHNTMNTCMTMTSVGCHGFSPLVENRMNRGSVGTSTASANANFKNWMSYTTHSNVHSNVHSNAKNANSHSLTRSITTSTTTRLNASSSSSSSSFDSPKSNSNSDSISNQDINSSKDNTKLDQISSSRGRNAVSLLPVYLTDARAVTKYDPVHAPNGALQLSVAENQMLEDLLVPAIRKFATMDTTTHSDEGTNTEDNDSNDDTKSGNPIQGLFHPDQIYYQPTHGRASLREAMSQYLHTVLKLSPHQQLDIDGMILGAGCNAVLENLCFCVTQPGDAVLLPTPYYAAFEFDLVARAGLTIVPVHTMKYNNNTTSSNSHSTIPQSSYYPNTKSLNAAYDLAKASGSDPKILLLSHPNNPLGVCYPPSVIKECITWAREKKVHLISDEIYAGSVYRKTNPLTGEDTFQSALTIAAAMNDDNDNKNNDNDKKSGLGLGPYIHFVYALSKDFALSGLRVGVAYSENEAIRLPMQKLNDLCQISSQTQQTVEAMLTATVTDGEDDEDSSHCRFWATDEFLPQNNERIKIRSDRVQLCLEDCNIPCLFGDSGLFLWMDLTEFLPSPTTSETEDEESEESKDARERELYLELLQEYGLLFTPGRSMRNEVPGFFRFVFTAASDDEFELGLERIKAYVKAKRS